MTPLLRACSGLIVWAVLFSLLYAIEGVGCAQGWDATALRSVLVVTWLAGVAALSVLTYCSVRDRSKDLTARIRLYLSATGLAATFVTGLPVATLSLCL